MSAPPTPAKRQGLEFTIAVGEFVLRRRENLPDDFTALLPEASQVFVELQLLPVAALVIKLRAGDGRLLRCTVPFGPAFELATEPPSELPTRKSTRAAQS